MLIEADGSVRIAWAADGFSAIHVLARFRPRAELEAFAREVADAALLNRSLPDLGLALRGRFPGAFDLSTRNREGAHRTVLVSFHPPRGEPNPDE